MDMHQLSARLRQIENSPKQSIFENIGQGDQYFRTWERDIHPILCEVALQPDQIQQLFKSIETGAGRSMLGKAGDAVGAAKDKISDVWFNKFGGMLQSSAPVQAFDQKFEEIKASIAAKNPQLAAKLAKYGEFAKSNPNLHKFLLAVAGSAAAALGVAVAGGIGAGALAVGTGTAIAVGIVNIADRLLQGQKASTAIGRGATAGAVAGITAGAMAKLGGWLSGLREKSIPIGDTGIENVTYQATRTIRGPGMEMSDMVQGFNIAANPAEASAVRAAMNAIKNGDVSAFRDLQDVARIINSKEYKEGIQATIGAAKQVAFNNDSLLQWINGLTQVATTAGGAVAGQAAGATGEKPVAESLNRNQLNELFGITGNKVDASTLEKAWTKAGSPTDSEEVAKILQGAGVDPAVISKAYADMSLPAPAGAVEPTTNAKPVNIKDMIDQILKLSPADQQQVLAYLKK